MLVKIFGAFPSLLGDLLHNRVPSRGAMAPRSRNSDRDLLFGEMGILISQVESLIPSYSGISKYDISRKEGLFYQEKTLQKTQKYGILQRK
ncbi:hypothetical protein CSB09_00375 [Candidatus Gracilibacteria bacterium]|nr:MAG: hypothetical protein CSB09_00375 [Candidatus Gracilibacteria bacterium]